MIFWALFLATVDIASRCAGVEDDQKERVMLRRGAKNEGAILTAVDSRRSVSRGLEGRQVLLGNLLSTVCNGVQEVIWSDDDDDDKTLQFGEESS